MPEKHAGSRSGNTLRQVARAFKLRLNGTYKTNEEAGASLPNPVSSQGFGKQYRKWVNGADGSTQATEMLAVEGTRAYIGAVKKVSKLVEEERQRRPTSEIILKATGVQLSDKAINKHVRAGLAGKSPLKRGVQERLPSQLKQKMRKLCKGAADDLAPFLLAT